MLLVMQEYDFETQEKSFFPDFPPKFGGETFLQTSLNFRCFRLGY